MDNFANVTRNVSAQWNQDFTTFTNTLRFSTVSPQKLQQLIGNINLKNFRDNCDWASDFIDYNPHRLWLYNTYTNVPYGVCDLADPENIYGKNFFYIDIECAVNPTLHEPYITSGRLLWCYILNYIFSINNQQPFVVYCHAIDIAKGYHLKMGMLSYNDTFGTTPTLRNVLKEELLYIPMDPVGNEYLDITSNDDGIGGLLFYTSKDWINYNDILSIYTSVPLSNQGFSSSFGGKNIRHRRKRKKSKKYRRKRRQRTRGGKKK